MPPLERIGPASIALSIGVAAVGLGLAAWLWRDRARRDRELSAEDASHFVRQDLRRAIVAALMLLIAAGVLVGSRTEPKVDGRANLRFVEIWAAVTFSLLLMTCLALFDWFATRRYARRHRNALVREGFELIRDELRVRAGLPRRPLGENGTGAGHPLS